MDLRRYYRRALWLPLVFPVVAICALFPLAVVGGPLGGMAAALAMILFGSLVIGGLPYLVFLAAFRGWAATAPERRVRREALLAPLRYASVLSLFALPFALASRAGQAFPLFWTFSGCALVLGYFYVGLVELWRVVLLRREARAHPALAAPSVGPP